MSLSSQASANLRKNWKTLAEGEPSRCCQDKYLISWATVIANKTTIFDIKLAQQLGILT